MPWSAPYIDDRDDAIEEPSAVQSIRRIGCGLRVREGDQTDDKVNEIPEQLRKRLLAVKSSKEMMVDNRLVDGLQIEQVIEERWLAPSNVALCIFTLRQLVAASQEWRGPVTLRFPSAKSRRRAIERTR